MGFIDKGWPGTAVVFTEVLLAEYRGLLEYQLINMSVNLLVFFQTICF